jgi:hypothetical protein
MKTKSVQRLIQIAAIIWLVWIVVGGMKHSDFHSLVMGGIFGLTFFVQCLIGKIIPQTAVRCRFLEKFVWVFILLTVIFTVLGCINFDASTLEAIAYALIFTIFMWVVTYMEQQRLSDQLVKEQNKCQQFKHTTI